MSLSSYESDKAIHLIAKISPKSSVSICPVRVFLCRTNRDRQMLTVINAELLIKKLYKE